jgi:hypothetical protein
MKGGVLYEDFTRSFGQDDPDLLVWRAFSLLKNPALRAERVERERRLDPSRFAREYEAEFTADLEAFLPSAWVDQAVMVGRRELPPRNEARYVAAVDPSGGGADAFTLAIVHAEGQGAERRVVQDVMKSWSRGRSATADLEGAVREIVAIVKRYHLSTVYGDRYASGWVRERFAAQGLRYEAPEIQTAGTQDGRYLDKSRAYMEIEPLLAQGRISLLDEPRLIRELKLLERHPRAGGKTVVDHTRGSHDDHANALAVAIAKAIQGKPRPMIYST